jgi:DNA-binding GntR family transcriptional regulator
MHCIFSPRRQLCVFDQLLRTHALARFGAANLYLVASRRIGAKIMIESFPAPQFDDDFEGRGPLREALRHLEGMRLVKRIPNAGARVVVLDFKTMSDLYAVREALEGMACRIAATRMTEDEIDQLSRLLDNHEMQIKQQGGGVYSQSEGDLDFHFQIVRGSRNEMLMDMLGSEQYQLQRMCRYRTSRNAQRTQPALQQHRQIVEALAQRDGELAEMLMRRHIQGAWRSISETIAKEEQI